MILKAFFDESADHISYGIGGCVASLEEWKEFEVEWKAVLKRFHVRGLHMKELAHFKADYSDWDEVRRHAFLGDLLVIMDRHVQTFIGAVVSKQAWGALTDEERGWFFGEPYYPSFQECARGAALQAWLGLPDDKVEMNFARHPQFTGRAAALYEAMCGSDHFGALRKRFGGIAFQDPYELVPLQAADLVAYEWRKKVSDLLTGHDRTRYPMQQFLKKKLNALFIKFGDLQSLRTRIYFGGSLPFPNFG
jgi:hypothetical protein